MSRLFNAFIGKTDRLGKKVNLAFTDKQGLPCSGVYTTDTGLRIEEDSLYIENVGIHVVLEELIETNQESALLQSQENGLWFFLKSNGDIEGFFQMFIRTEPPIQGDYSKVGNLFYQLSGKVVT